MFILSDPNKELAGHVVLLGLVVLTVLGAMIAHFQGW